MTEELTPSALAIDQSAEAAPGGNAVNVIFPQESATKLASALHRNGIIMGAIGAASAVLLLWAIHVVNQDETAHTLCAYEFNGLAAQVAARRGDTAKMLADLRSAGCNR